MSRVRQTGFSKLWTASGQPRVQALRMVPRPRALDYEADFLDECQKAYRNGADLDASDAHPPTNVNRMCYAAERGWCESVRWLIQHGADVDAPLGYNGMTPLHTLFFCGQGDYSIANLLLDAGASVDARNNSSWTPLLHMCFTGNVDKVKFLLSRGASIDGVRGPDGSPLIRNQYDGTTRPNDPEALARDHARDVAKTLHQGYDTGHTYYAEDRACDLAICKGASAAADLLADVRAAGGWAAYVAAPREQLLALRRELPTLRREPPRASAHLERLFLDPRVPDDVFTHVFAFWRSERDSDA